MKKLVSILIIFSIILSPYTSHAMNEEIELINLPHKEVRLKKTEKEVPKKVNPYALLENEIEMSEEKNEKQLDEKQANLKHEMQQYAKVLLLWKRNINI